MSGLPDTDLVEARAPTTAPARLVELSQSEVDAVRNAVAENPSTPLDTLETLWVGHPSAFHRNPVVALLQIAQPDFVRSLRPETLAAVLACDETRVDLLLESAHRPERMVKRAIATHRSTPPWLLVELGRSYFLYEEVAANPGTPTDYLGWLATHPWASVRLALADNPELPDDVRAVLSDDVDPAVRARVARRGPRALVESG